MDQTEPTLCRYCLSPLAPSALKCKDCLEFVVQPTKSSTPKASVGLEVYRTTTSALAKAALPLAIVVILIVFHDELSALMIRARSAHFGGVEIVFDVPGISHGSVSLQPVSLYYLLGATKYGGQGSWNWDVMSAKEREQIFTLKTKGLATVSVKPCAKDHDCKEEVFIHPTGEGNTFLRAIGLADVTVD